ncbi:MAG: hypothetical protein Q9M09_00775 [Mariprofundaceae bacterium]|nr:hypothetical protein [Mariprofundaceae bacterium]
MRYVIIILLLIVAYFGAVHLSGGAFYGFGLPLGGERAKLRQISSSFMEDIQFKDFKKAASYHEPDAVDQVDIPYLLQRLFLQKPEALDIMEYEIVFCKLDSTTLRGRAKMRVKIKNLIDKKLRTQDFILFYHRAHAHAPWYMELESSLRKVEANQEKKH